MNVSPRRLAFCSMLLLPACGEVALHLGKVDTTSADTQTTTLDTDGSDSMTSDPSDTDIESDSDTDLVPMTQDLFACERDPAWNTCETVYYHISPEPRSAMECSAQVIASREPGLLSGLESIGPDLYETERFIAVFGDGTALVQRRHRSCDPTSPLYCDPDVVQWTLYPQQICELASQSAVEACVESCEGDCNCGWDPFFDELTNCVDTEAWDCDALGTLLDDASGGSGTTSDEN